MVKVKKKKMIKKSAPKTDEKYPNIIVSKCTGDNAIRFEDAKKILGWFPEDMEEGLDFGTDYILKDVNGVKIRMLHNKGNRPFYYSDAQKCKQEVLRKRWKLNGETFIIGKSGQVCNGQHSFTGLILAVQEWRKDPSKWEEWDEEPYMERIGVFGIDEDDATINTIDTAKPRSLTDVIFRSDKLSGMNLERSEIKRVAKICSFAVKTVWDRTGAKDAFNVHATHSEVMDFLDKHPRILECVELVYIENVENSLSRYLSLGQLAGMVYLMGCSNTDPKDYKERLHESSLDWSNWDSVNQFVCAMSADTKAVKGLKYALERVLADTGGSRAEQIAVLVEGWKQWVASEKVEDFKLEYGLTNDGVKVLTDTHSFGGIDLLELED